MKPPKGTNLITAQMSLSPAHTLYGQAEGLTGSFVVEVFTAYTSVNAKRFLFNSFNVYNRESISLSALLDSSLFF